MPSSGGSTTAATSPGKWILTAGLGGMGGAQPLAATMAGASMLAIECDPARIEKRLQTRYLDRRADSLDEALALIEESARTKTPVSVGVVGNAAEIVPELLRRGVRPDAVTDQTSAHDPLNGYLPAGWTLERWRDARERDPQARRARPRSARWSRTSRRCSAFHRLGVPTFDYGNNIRQMALDGGFADAFAFPGFVPAYIRPLFCRGVGPFRWVALSGDPDDIAKTDAKVKSCCRTTRICTAGSTWRASGSRFRDCRRASAGSVYGDRDRVGLAFNAMVASGELKAPIVIGRDHLDSGSVASPNRETEAMRDGSDAVSDWPLLNAMLNVAGGATWVSIHHGGGVGIGYSQHAGMVIVVRRHAKRRRSASRACCGTIRRAASRGTRTPATNRRSACAREHGLRLPMHLTPVERDRDDARAASCALPICARCCAATRSSCSTPRRRPPSTGRRPSIASIAAQDASVYGVNTGFGKLAQTRSRARSSASCSATSSSRTHAASARRWRARSCGSCSRSRSTRSRAAIPACAGR